MMCARSITYRATSTGIARLILAIVLLANSIIFILYDNGQRDLFRLECAICGFPPRLENKMPYGIMLFRWSCKGLPRDSSMNFDAS